MQSTNRMHAVALEAQIDETDPFFVFRLNKNNFGTKLPPSIVFVVSHIEKLQKTDCIGFAALHITNNSCEEFYVSIGHAKILTMFDGNKVWLELLDAISPELNSILTTNDRLDNLAPYQNISIDGRLLYDIEQFSLVATCLKSKLARQTNVLLKAQFSSFFDSLVINKKLFFFTGGEGCGKSFAVNQIADFLDLDLARYKRESFSFNSNSLAFFNCNDFIDDEKFSLHLENFLTQVRAANVLSVIECRDLALIHRKIHEYQCQISFPGFDNDQKKMIVKAVQTSASEEKIELGLKLTRSEPGVTGLLNFLSNLKCPNDTDSLSNRLSLPQGVHIVGVNRERSYIYTLQTKLIHSQQGSFSVTGGADETFIDGVRCAYNFLRSCHAYSALLKSDLLIHVAGAAGSKAGTSASAGIAMAIALGSNGRTQRSDTAVIGEIDLFGNIRAVGAVKEKILAAARFGIQRLIAPLGNRHEVHSDANMRIFYVSHFDELEAIYLNDALT